HAGGRGKAGGVKVVKTLDDVREQATRLLGSTLVTHQTGPKGQKVQRLYIEEGCDIKRELYLSFLVDRATSRVTLMASTEGGVEIEEVAAKMPEKILKTAIDPATGLMPFHARKIAFGLGLSGTQVNSAVKFLTGMYKAFIELDAAIVEINPLVVTGSGDIIALDAKMNFDDNALFRHADVLAMRDESEEDPAEREAANHELNYVKLDGNIGCMVNGAGLAMATMDIIKLFGGEPANFLDVGGGATKERVTTAFKIILSDTNVKAILVNIFGGIMRCDIIAEGIIAAAKEVKLSVPLVVRLEGTNVDLGKKMLAESGLPIVSGNNLADAAEKVVRALKAKAA
ncbi:MAG TPA: ADP-forming succinate--CoA ligase subunit beta, partial [Alphaproteobacteria bacterium]|nr:ADP-forming succinate--CoA ligase subunit beta [Alphaproteobacteria bacterium]